MTNPKEALKYYDSKNSSYSTEKIVQLVDNVSHPSHYTNGSIECIDAIESSMSFDSYCGYLKGNVMKYVWRCMLKNNPVEDLKKAKWYLTRLINVLEESSNNANND